MQREKFRSDRPSNEPLAVEAHYAESDELVSNFSGYVTPFTSQIGPIGFDTTARFVGTFGSVEIWAPAHQGVWKLGVGHFSADLRLRRRAAGVVERGVRNRRE